MSETRHTPRRRNERFITVLPIDPTHAWVFWELLPGDSEAHVHVQDADGNVLLARSPAEPTGDAFVTLPRAGAVIEAVLECRGAPVAHAEPLPLPADRPGLTPPALRTPDIRPREAARPFVPQAPPGSMYGIATPGGR